MVTKVPPNCTSIDASSVNSSLFSLQAMEFAKAVIDAVNSQEFIRYHPFYFMKFNRFCDI